VIALLSAANPPIDWRHAEPGFTALIVVGVLFVAVAFLWRSFLKHAKRAREPWEGEDEGD
jgi:hypothetical protein